MSLRVLAISAPQWVSNAGLLLNSELRFSSKAPFSLQNALRDAVDMAKTGKSKIWSSSNLAEYNTRQHSVIMLEYWEEEKENFMELFDSIQPHLLLIGSMTLSLPGAIEIAKYAKKKRGNEVCVVIGGKHINETMFKNRLGEIKHHVGSPLLLMREEVIPEVFDVLVSGDGEKIITKIGEAIGALVEEGRSLSNFRTKAEELNIDEAEGSWVMAVHTPEKDHIFQSQGANSIDYSTLGLVVEQFDWDQGFEIFKTKHTVHAYSDSSRGCIYDCFFCSEKHKISGEVRIKTETSVYRLLKQFECIHSSPKASSTSIFVEDSIFLNGRVKHIQLFVDLLRNKSIRIPFGIQLTLDVFFELPKELLRELKECGLEYLAFGIETVDENVARSLSKNSKKQVSWVERTEAMVIQCSELGFKCGMFIIWGLKETQDMRRSQLLQIHSWIIKYDIPIDIGLNLATQHPLQIVDDTTLHKFNYTKYDYSEWGTESNSEYLPYFVELFGEASIRYSIFPDSIPKVSELAELRELFQEIKQATYNLVS